MKLRLRSIRFLLPDPIHIVDLRKTMDDGRKYVATSIEKEENSLPREISLNSHISMENNSF